jgi:O-acetyl-ADP-ribose deacetylase (regulator of RNase III)
MNLFLQSGMGQYYQSAINVALGDIATMEVDAIVNSANPLMVVGGGVDRAIHVASGTELLKEYIQTGGCKQGGAVITKGYELPAKFVIHTVAPVYGRENGNEATILKNCYLSSLSLAFQNNIHSIAFPSIGTGVFGYPIDDAATIAVKTVKDWLEKYLYEFGFAFTSINFVVFSERDKGVYMRVLNEAFREE